MLLRKFHVNCLKPTDIILHAAIVAVLRNYDRLTCLIINFQNASEIGLYFVKLQLFRVDRASIVHFNPHKPMLFANCQINTFLCVLAFGAYLFNCGPIFALFFDVLLLFLHLAMHADFRCTFRTDFNQLIHYLASRKW